MSLNFPDIWCDVIPVIRIQMMPFWPDAETSKEQSPADVKKGHFSIFMTRLFKQCSKLIGKYAQNTQEARVSIQLAKKLGSPEGDGMQCGGCSWGKRVVEMKRRDRA